LSFTLPPEASAPTVVNRPHCAAALIWACASASSVCTGPLHAQAGTAPTESWNAPEALALIDRARHTRSTLAVSGDLSSYRARLNGQIYFFIDPEVGERHLIRIDQIAAELAWEAPDRLQQHVVGERSEARLPVREFDYYPDRLTLVPYGFGNEIRVGSGRDVARVPHPLAPAESAALGGEVYDFQLGGSLTLVVPGRESPLRIREVAVRPRDPSRPGFVGTLHLDEDSGSLVRTIFTFTPASYVDPRNDQVTVEMDYALWEDRYWLPNLQRIEVRREIPGLDIGIGTIIRSVLRVSGYELNVPIPNEIRARPPITFAPPESRAAFAFETGLYDRLQLDGLQNLILETDPRELRARAMEILGRSPPSGLSPFRFHLPNLSSALRYRRAEGLRVGVGGSLEAAPGARLRGSGGYAASSESLQLTASVAAALGPAWWTDVQVRVRDTDDLGLTPASAPLLSSLAALVRGEDYTDPFEVTGASWGLERESADGGRLRFQLGVERHRSLFLELGSAPLDRARAFRPVRPVADSDFFVAGVTLLRLLEGPLGGRGLGTFEVTGLQGQAGGGLAFRSEVEERWANASGSRELELRGVGWAWAGDPLPQGHRLIGGRETLPGFPFRVFYGTRAFAGSALASFDVWRPFIGLRAGVHGAFASGGAPAVRGAWATAPTDGLKTSVSAGVSAAWNLLHLDLARGLGEGGEWQLLFSVDRGWWEWF
jgi:hypothetical protein